LFVSYYIEMFAEIKNCDLKMQKTVFSNSR